MSLFVETDDQQLFAEASRRFLEARFPISRVRALAEIENGFDPALWKEAAALGWTTLLVPEEAGGGSISGNGLADALILTSLFGQFAAPGPVLGTNVVAAALGRWGTPDQHQGALAELLAGTAVAAWGRGDIRAERAGDRVVLHGRVSNVESAADIRYLLVDGGGALYLVPLPGEGIEVAALRTIDLTRRFSDVMLEGVTLPVGAQVGEAGSAADHEAHLLDLLAVMVMGELVGTMDRAFAMTLEWTFNRYSFGRPLASYQAIKHRLADRRTQLEAGEAVAARAAVAVGTGTPDARAWASAGMAYVAQHAPELIQECIQLHGGIGVTYDHDLHVFLRRAALDANLYGTYGEFAGRLGALVAAR